MLSWYCTATAPDLFINPIVDTCQQLYTYHTFQIWRTQAYVSHLLFVSLGRALIFCSTEVTVPLLHMVVLVVLEGLLDPRVPRTVLIPSKRHSHTPACFFG